MKVYIYIKKDGTFPNINFNIIEKGFKERMYDIIYFKYEDINNIKFCKDTPIIAGSPIIHKILNNNNIYIENIEIPKGLDIYLKRKIKKITVKEAKELFQNGEKFFIKPFNNHKLFTGFILDSSKGYNNLIGLTDDTILLKSEIINIISEYRCYVNDGKIIGCYNYNGDSTIFPDMKIINNTLETLKKNNNNFISAYSLDFGINGNNETFFIEANDSISLGNYGLSPFLHTKMIINRWKEINK